MLVDASHDKVSGTRRPRHIRRFHVPEEGCRTKLYPTTDEKHHTPWKEHGSRIQEKRVFRVGGGARVKASRMNTACSATFGDQMMPWVSPRSRLLGSGARIMVYGWLFAD